MSLPPESRLDRWLSRPWAPFLGIALGVALALPSIALGFFADDDFLLAFMEKRTPLAPPWYDLYRLVSGDQGAWRAAIAVGQMPWWAAPGLRLHLVRPLTSALLSVDHGLFGDSPFGYHLHSIAWWALLLVGLRALFRRILPAPTAWLAVVVFAVADASVFPYAWIAARHCLVATAPVVLGLVAVVRARQEGWAPGRWLAPLAMIVGLAGGETALGGLAFWVCYEVAGPARPSTWSARARLVSVPIAIGLAYLALYALVHGGARASGGYVDPSSPVAFALAAGHRYPALLAAAFLDFPAELAAVLPTLPFAVLAIVGGAGAWLLWRASGPFLEDSERAAMRWLVPGALLAMLGALGGFPGSRELIVANVAWAALFAILIRHGFRAGASGGAGLVARRVGASFVVLIHVVLAPLAALVNIANTVHMASLVDRSSRAPLFATRALDAQLLVVNASDPMALVYPSYHLLREDRLGGQCIALLGAVKADVRVTREDDRTLVIEPEGRPMLRGPFETLYRAEGQAFHPGDEVRTCNADVRVLAVDADGAPTRIQARLDRPLDDPSVRVAVWKDGALTALALTKDETQEIRWTPGPMSLF